MFWFVNKRDKYGLVFDGKPENLLRSLDEREALDRWKSKPPEIETNTFDLRVHWVVKKFSLPIINSEKEFTDVSEQFFEYLSKYSERKILSDITMWVRKDVLKHYIVASITSWNSIYICFVRKDKPDSALTDTPVEKRQSLLLKKEFLLWYVRPDPILIEVRNWSKKENKEMNISSEYEVEWWSVKYNYTASLREFMFTSQVQLPSWYLLQEFQYEVIRNLSKETYVVVPRRWGKTIMSALILVQEAMRQSFHQRTQLRPLKCIYVWLTKAKNKVVITYIKNMLEGMIWKGSKAETIFKEVKSNDSHTIELYSWGKVVSEILFVTANQDNPWVWEFCDFVLIDEAGYVPESVYDGLHPFVMNEWARMLCVSTNYRGTKKNWFYRNLVRAEKESRKDLEDFIDEEFEKCKDIDLTTNEGRVEYSKMVADFRNKSWLCWLRYDLNDVEHISEYDKEEIIKRLSNPERMEQLVVEYFSRFPDEGKELDYEWCVVGIETIKWNKYNLFSVWYDPAETSDKPWLCIFWYSTITKNAAILKTAHLKQTSQIADQHREMLDIVDEVVKEYWESNSITYYSFDVTWWRRSNKELFEMSWKTVYAAFVWSWVSQWIKENNSIFRNEYTANKASLVADAKNSMAWWYFVIPSEWNETFIGELNDYQSLPTSSGSAKYWAVSWWTDDIVSAMLMARWLIYQILWKRYEITRVRTSQEKKIKDMTPEQLYAYNKLKDSEDKALKARSEYLNSKEYFRKLIY